MSWEERWGQAAERYDRRIREFTNWVNEAPITNQEDYGFFKEVHDKLERRYHTARRRCQIAFLNFQIQQLREEITALRK